MEKLPSQTPAANIGYDVTLVNGETLTKLAPRHIKMILNEPSFLPDILSLTPNLRLGVENQAEWKPATDVPVVYFGTQAAFAENRDTLLMTKSEQKFSYAVTTPVVCFDQDTQSVLAVSKMKKPEAPEDVVQTVNDGLIRYTDVEAFQSQQKEIYNDSYGTLAAYLVDKTHLFGLSLNVYRDNVLNEFVPALPHKQAENISPNQLKNMGSN